MNNTTTILDFVTDLGEMYSNSQEKEKKKENTFHFLDQEDNPLGVNVSSAKPTVSPAEAAAPGVTREGQSFGESSVLPIRRVSREDIYTDIMVQMTEPKGTNKVIRTTAYISLMPDDTDRYKIKLTCNLTTKTDETLRGCDAKNTQLRSVIEAYRATYPGVMLGRCRYTRVRGSYSVEYKKNLSSALLAVWMDEDGEMVAEFYLLGEYFPLTLGELSEAQQEFYVSQFEYHTEVGEID